MSEHESEDEGEDEDDVPRLVVGRIREIASWLSPPVAKAQGDRPIWFLLEGDDDLHELFERLPEGTSPPRVGAPNERETRALLAGLRAFATEKADELQAWLGPTDSIVFGFHADASLDDVVASFEDDGFLVIASVREGRLVAEGEDG